MKMKTLLLALFLLAASATFAWGQTTLAVDIEKATLTWTWAQGTGGAVDEFRMYCGATPGVYDPAFVISDITTRSVLVLDILSGPGTYFCAVSAADAFGESRLSNEVTFDAGNIPLPPTDLKVTAQ